MKLRTMLYGLTLMLGCFVLASCVNDEEGPCLPDGKTEVLFSLVLQDNAQTRTGNETWNSYKPSETGVEYDNYIELAKVQMLLFNASTGAYVGKLGSLTYTQSGKNKYQYIGTAPTGLDAGVEYKFVVLANCDDANLTVGTSTIADLNTKTFNYYADADNTQYIPMWGVLKASLTLVAGNRQDIGPIDLLRAMSKVTVKLEAKQGATGDPLRGYSLKSVTLSKFNKGGYITPNGAATANTTKELNLDNSLHANTALGTGDDRPFDKVVGDSLVFYLEEYDNSTTPAILNVTVSKTVNNIPKSFTAAIQFCDYEEGAPKAGATPYNIIRNHWYKFDIYSVSDDGTLSIKPYVLPWDYNAKNSSEFTTKGSSVLTVLDRTPDGQEFRYKICNSNGVGQNPSRIDWGDAWAAVAYDPDFVSGGQNNPKYNTLLELTVSFEHDSHMVLESSDVNFGFVYRKPKTSSQDPDSYSEILDALTIDDTTAVYNEADGTYTVTYYVVPKPTSSEGEKAEVSLIMYSAGMATKMPYNSSILPGSSDNTGAYFYRVSSSVWDSIDWYTQNV